MAFLRTSLLRVCLIVWAWSSAGIAGAAEPAYDLVIRQGRIIDGAGNPGFAGDVAVRGDGIVAVGRVEGLGRRELVARGRVVAGGCIEIDSRSDWLLMEDGGAPCLF